jgi:hypothetical protein
MTSFLNISARAALTFILAAFAALPAAQAGDAIFTHTYLAETLPEGAKEVEQWVTYREKTSQGLYRLWQTRTEFEYGLTKRWTVSLYANAYSVTAQNNNSVISRNNYTASGDGDEVSGGGPVTFGPYVPFNEQLPLPSARYSKTDFESLSVESIYQFMSPLTDPLGLAGYVEYSFGAKTQELEFKLLAQKNLLEDRLILAGNVAIEFESEKWSGITTEKETKLVFSGGASYQVAPGWRLGLELRNERNYEGGHSLSGSNKDYSAWFAGPTVHYAAQRFWVTAGYQQQMPWARAYSVAAQNELIDHRVYKGAEKNTLRLLIGTAF